MDLRTDPLESWGWDDRQGRLGRLYGGGGERGGLRKGSGDEVGCGAGWQSPDSSPDLLFLALLTCPRRVRLGDTEVLSLWLPDPVRNPGGPEGQPQGREAASA